MIDIAFHDVEGKIYYIMAIYCHGRALGGALIWCRENGLPEFSNTHVCRATPACKYGCPMAISGNFGQSGLWGCWGGSQLIYFLRTGCSWVAEAFNAPPSSSSCSCIVYACISQVAHSGEELMRMYIIHYYIFYYLFILFFFFFLFLLLLPASSCFFFILGKAAIFWQEK